jgi:hypothetical protein
MDQASIENNTFTRDKPRYYNTSLESNKFERTDKGLLVRDVILLAEGSWTDSNVRTPCYYSPEVLEKYSKNWLDNGLWSRHPGGSPRSVADKIGAVVNFYYSAEYKAIMGDLLFHCKSQLSRDIAEMVQNGLVNAVSVEIGGEEYYNRKAKVNEAVSIDGYGVAVVDRGACDVCLIRHKSAPEPTENANSDTNKLLAPDEGSVNDSPEEGAKSMDEEFKKLFDDLAARVAALEEKMAPSKDEEAAPEDKPEDEEPNKEMSAKLELMFKELSDAKEKIKLLENTAKPVSQVTENQAKPKFEKKLIGKFE